MANGVEVLEETPAFFRFRNAQGQEDRMAKALLNPSQIESLRSAMPKQSAPPPEPIVQQSPTSKHIRYLPSEAPPDPQSYAELPKALPMNLRTFASGVTGGLISAQEPQPITGDPSRAGAISLVPPPQRQAVPPPKESFEQYTPAPAVAQAGGPMGMFQQLAMGAGPGGGRGTSFREQRQIESERLRAAEMASVADAAELNATREALARREEFQLREQGKEAQAAAAWQQARDEKQRQIEADSQRISQMKVDPNRYWAKHDTGTKILAGIATALGVVGGALSRTGRNLALERIDQFIERDLELQRDEIGRAKEGVEQQRGLLAMMRQNYADDREAMRATRAISYDLLAAQVEQIGLSAKEERIKANAAQLAPEIRAKGMMERNALANDASERSYRNAKLQLERAELIQKGMGGPGAGKPLDQGQIDQLAEIDKAEKALDDLYSQAKQHGGFLSGGLAQKLGSKETKQFGVTSKAVTQIVGKGLEGGKMTDSDREFYRDMTIQPGDTQETIDAKYAALKARVGDSRAALLGAARAAGRDISGFSQPQEYAPNSAKRVR